jgi:DNA polymerase (family X)
MTTNEEIAEHLQLLADLYSLSGDDQRTFSFAKAAASIRSYPSPIWEMKLAPSSVKYCGPSTIKVITEFLESGSSSRLSELEKTCQLPPQSVRDLTKIANVGLVTATKLWKEQGINSLEELEVALSSGKIDDEKLKKDFEFFKAQLARIPLEDALPIAERIYDFLVGIQVDDQKAKTGKRYLVQRAEFAGSLRRQRPTVKDIDIVVASANDFDTNHIRELLRASFPDIVADGPTRTRLRIDGRGVDVIFTSTTGFGCCLQYLTGGMAFNIRLRTFCKTKHLKLNETNLTFMEGTPSQKVFTFLTEEALFEHLGLWYIEPERREVTLRLEYAISLRDLKKVKKLTLDQAIYLRDEHGITNCEELDEFLKGL